MYLIIVIIILIDRKSAFDQFFIQLFSYYSLAQFVSLKYVFLRMLQFTEGRQLFTADLSKL